MNTYFRKTLAKYVSLIFAILSFGLAVFFDIKIQEKSSLFASLINTALSSKDLSTIEDTVMAISREIYNNTNGWVEKDALDCYSRWEALGFSKMSASVGLKYKCYGVKVNLDDGPCEKMIKIFPRSMWELGIPDRKLQLMEVILGKGEHTMTELFYNGKWRLISPSNSSFV